MSTIYMILGLVSIYYFPEIPTAGWLCVVFAAFCGVKIVSKAKEEEPVLWYGSNPILAGTSITLVMLNLLMHLALAIK